MDEIVFSDFGIDIVKRFEKFYLRYDAGELVVKMAEIEISKEECTKAQISEQDAYEVILAHQNAQR